jgi:hypothetical protein
VCVTVVAGSKQSSKFLQPSQQNLGIAADVLYPLVAVLFAAPPVAGVFVLLYWSGGRSRRSIWVGGRGGATAIASLAVERSGRSALAPADEL